MTCHDLVPSFILYLYFTLTTSLRPLIRCQCLALVIISERVYLGLKKYRGKNLQLLENRVSTLYTFSQKTGSLLEYIWSKSIEWLIECQAFSPSYGFAFFTSAIPLPLSSASCLSFSVFLCVASRVCWRQGGGQGVGGRSQIEKVWTSIYHAILSASLSSSHRCLMEMTLGVVRQLWRIPS